MKKIQTFFTGILLLFVVFAMLVLVTFIYRACDRSSIKTYIFQMNNNANQRTGVLQNINDISAVDLRNKLIKKYISEYFKVIPGDTNPQERPVLISLSSSQAFEYWKNNELPEIINMSTANMFRMAHVDEDGIATLNKTGDIDYTSSIRAESVYYLVRYKTITWSESNKMEIEPVKNQGTLYIEARFKPGLISNENIKGRDKKGKYRKMTLREYLENGNDPVGLFMFEVTNIGDKVVK